jgi:hypothetical protein
VRALLLPDKKSFWEECARRKEEEIHPLYLSLAMYQYFL